MVQSWFSVAALILVSAGLASCAGNPPETAPTASPSAVSLPPGSKTARPEDEAAQAALAAYELYWQISEQAGHAPRQKDWRPELAKAMADPALTDYVNEVANLASVPAHTVGRYGRGLLAEPVSEILYRDLLRIEYRAGNLAAVRQTADKLTALAGSLDLELDEETSALVSTLLAGRP